MVGTAIALHMENHRSGGRIPASSKQLRAYAARWDEGFDTKVFGAEQPDSQTVVLSYLSPDGEAGFPETLT